MRDAMERLKSLKEEDLFPQDNTAVVSPAMYSFLKTLGGGDANAGYEVAVRRALRNLKPLVVLGDDDDAAA
jgi:hypothetical protein